MNNIKNWYTIALIFIFISAYGQEHSYDVTLTPISIDNLGGLQSFALATHKGEWLIIGGRLDGLHRRQPFAAFDEAGNNKHIMVVNPSENEVWKATYSQLPAHIKEQLSATNIQFQQDGNHLILTGGYAYSQTSGDHITFPYITIVDVEQLISEVKSNAVSASSFMQQKDQKFAVTGGGLEMIEDVFYLVGGQRFDGRYNPMGPNHGPGFKQEYTNEIRPFKLSIETTSFTVEHLPETHDEMHLHRRDYNLSPQIKDGKEELMLFSGVFQTSSNIPFLYPVSITENSYEPIQDFSQYYNHYHCASLPIYNESNDEMHNIFFGGIAQFYVDDGLLVQDNDVPFVNTIADVTRNKAGTLAEKILNAKMPDLLGAGSEFILLEDTPQFNNGVLKGDLLTANPMDIGYIYGGIRSSLPNIFFTNEGSQSNASNTVFKVSISKSKSSTQVDVLPEVEKILIYPNPAQNIVRMLVELTAVDDIKIEVYDMKGGFVSRQTISRTNLKVGKNYLKLDKLNVSYGAYLYKITMKDKSFIRKVVWSE